MKNIVRKNLLTAVLTLAALFIAGTAMAATSVSWLSPPNGSSYLEGTIVNPVGQASGSGITGGTGLDLMLVIDTSASMTYGSDKIGAAKTAAVAMLNSLPAGTTQVGIVTFDYTSNVYRVLQDLTSNRTALISAVNALTAPGGATAIGSGINAATSELLSGRAIAGHAKMQVVLSDGLWNSGVSPYTAAQNAWNNQITVHTVGVAGHDVNMMSQIAAIGHGVYTNVTNLATLEALFDGTGGNLVALDHVDIELPDGTILSHIATDGLGNFVLPDWVMELGPNTFKATAIGTDGSSATALLNLNGQSVPEPASMLLFGTGLLGLAGISRRKKASN